MIPSFKVKRKITVSIVSHGQLVLVIPLLDQLSRMGDHIEEVVITHNVPEAKCNISLKEMPFRLREVTNPSPLGFGANHNQAFQYCRTDFFCVMNPDITLEKDPFDGLLSCCTSATVAVVAPLVVTPEGHIADNARVFPTPLGLMRKAFFGYAGVYPHAGERNVEFPDWVAGMFMLIRSHIYEELSGFDEGFFLYYEDVDLCARVWMRKYRVALCRNIDVIHDARKSSHHDLRFLCRHISSAFRFFMKYPGRVPVKSDRYLD